MKKISAAIFGCMFFLCSCNNDKNSNEIHFATSAEYPPFEFMVQAELYGFDIDLAILLSKKLGKKAVFENMQFSRVLPALASGRADAAISTITITAERQNKIDFTKPYYLAAMGVVFKQDAPIQNESELISKKVACQLGSTMEAWLKDHIPSEQIMVVKSNIQAIEALKAGLVDAVLLDDSQSLVYSNKNLELAAISFVTSGDGYAIALKKGSPLQAELNNALMELESSGEIEKLKIRWLRASKE